MPSRSTLAPVTEGGSEMRAIRQHLGQTQREFAARLAVHHDTLGLWERGSHAPPRMALKLARYLVFSMPPDQVFLPLRHVDAPGVTVAPGMRCLWRQCDALPCSGRLFRAEARLSRRRRVQTEMCQAHLDEAFAEIFRRLSAAAVAEQQRLAGRRRKQLARLRAREAMAPAASVPPRG